MAARPAETKTQVMIGSLGCPWTFLQRNHKPQNIFQPPPRVIKFNKKIKRLGVRPPGEDSRAGLCVRYPGEDGHVGPLKSNLLFGVCGPGRQNRHRRSPTDAVDDDQNGTKRRKARRRRRRRRLRRKAGGKEGVGGKERGGRGGARRRKLRREGRTQTSSPRRKT